LERIREAFVALLKEIGFQSLDPKPVQPGRFEKIYTDILVGCEKETTVRVRPAPVPEPPKEPVKPVPAPAVEKETVKVTTPTGPAKLPPGVMPRRGKGGPSPAPVKSVKTPPAAVTPPKKGKAPTTWGRMNSQQIAGLSLADDARTDVTAPPPAGADEPLPPGIEGDLPDLDVPADAGSDDDGDEPAAAAAAAGPAAGASRPAAAAPGKPSKGGLGRGFFSLLKSIAGTRVLAREDLEAPLGVFRDGLMARNVAAPVCDQLCESVATTLDGRHLETLTVKATVRRALEEALTRILTPRRTIDVLRDALAAKTAGRPYVVTFCGVNGVGKSTSLAKVAYWLLNNGLSVLVGACDTFRAGAVEQLEVHVRRLSQHGHRIGLFGEARSYAVGLAAGSHACL
jgi:hypothetical protein